VMLPVGLEPPDSVAESLRVGRVVLRVTLAGFGVVVSVGPDWPMTITLG